MAALNLSVICNLFEVHTAIWYVSLPFKSYTSVFTPAGTHSRYRSMYNPTVDGGMYQSTAEISGSPYNQSTANASCVQRTISNAGNLSTICEDSEEANSKCVMDSDTNDKRPILS